MKKDRVELVQRRLDTALSVLAVLSMVSLCWVIYRLFPFRIVMEKGFHGDNVSVLMFFMPYFLLLLFLLFLCVAGVRRWRWAFLLMPFFAIKTFSWETPLFLQNVFALYYHRGSGFWASQAYCLSMTLLAVVGLLGFFTCVYARYASR